MFDNINTIRVVIDPVGDKFRARIVQDKVNMKNFSTDPAHREWLKDIYSFPNLFESAEAAQSVADGGLKALQVFHTRQ